MNHYLERIKKYLTWCFSMPVCMGRKICPEQVFFIPFQGVYACNLKYLCEELRHSHPEKKLFWCVRSEDDEATLPEGVHPVRSGSVLYYKVLSSSGYVFENAFNIVKLPVRKKKGQVFVQTMHGSLGIKKIDPSVGNARRNRRGFRSAKLSDCIISNSTFEDMVYRTSFWRNTKILKLGHARNDILFETPENMAKAEEIRRKIREFYGLDEDIKLALYAPTFSRTDYKKGHEPDGSGAGAETLDTAALLRALADAFGGRWKILMRVHPRDEKKKQDLTGRLDLLDGNAWGDIQELMLVSDAGITDYSSWIYDYVLTGKPGFIFAPDLASYEQATGFYYPLSETPFFVARTNAELEEGIESFSPESYAEKVKEFLEDKGCVDDGKAAQRIIAGIIR